MKKSNVSVIAKIQQAKQDSELIHARKELSTIYVRFKVEDNDHRLEITKRYPRLPLPYKD